MSYLDGIDIYTSGDAKAAIRAIRATRPMSAQQARGLIAASIGALERANAEDDEFIDITVKRIDLIGQLANMDRRLAQARGDVDIPEKAAQILRDAACDAIDEFDAAADDVPALAAQRGEVVHEVLGATASSQPAAESGSSKVLAWAHANPWRAGAVVAGALAFGLALFSAHSIGRSRR